MQVSAGRQVMQGKNARDEIDMLRQLRTKCRHVPDPELDSIEESLLPQHLIPDVDHPLGYIEADDAQVRPSPRDVAEALTRSAPEIDHRPGLWCKAMNLARVEVIDAKQHALFGSCRVKRLDIRSSAHVRSRFRLAVQGRLAQTLAQCKPGCLNGPFHGCASAPRCASRPYASLGAGPGKIASD